MNWEYKLLGELCDIQIGRTPARKEARFWGKGYPWLSISDMNQGRLIKITKESITEAAVKECRCRLVPANTLLMSFKLSIGKVGFNQVSLYTNEAITALSVKSEDTIFKPYLYWALQHVDLLQYVDKAAKGKTLNKKKLHRIEIPVPPLAEQQRIAAVLDKADALRTKRRAALAKLDTLLQSTFLHMFGDPVTNPMRIPTVPLFDLCTRITDGTHQSPKWADNGVPFLFVSNVVDGELTFNTKRSISMETYEQLNARCPIEQGDILFTIVGSYGNAAMVKTDRPFSFQRHIAHIKPDSSKVDSRFLLGMLQSPGVKRQADIEARGVAQKTLNLRELKKIEVFIPSMNKQIEYSKTRIKLMQQKKYHVNGLLQLDNLFHALQQRAFKGDL